MNYKRLYDQLMVSGSKDKFPLSHGHHIIPKHIGGTDDEWNFVFLTVRQHALAHRLLWKMDGRWQDKLGWQGLSGIIDTKKSSAKPFLKQTLVIKTLLVKAYRADKEEVVCDCKGSPESEETRRLKY